MIEAKARIHELDIFGTNALVGAIRRNHTRVIEILIEAGATLNLCTAVSEWQVEGGMVARHDGW